MASNGGATAVSEFEALRPHLLAVAYRLTGSFADAEDAVQDSWLRWNGLAPAERAGIAAGTLYRHFASKTDLLASALTREFQRLDASYDWAGSGTTPVQRLEQLTDHLHRRWQREPLLTEAMIRAFLGATTDAAHELDLAATVIERLLARALSGATPTPADRQVAAVIADIWLANLIAFVGGRASATDTRDRIDRATARILDRTPAATNNPERLLLVAERYLL